MDWPSTLNLLAHELRSPASVIMGYTRMLREGRLDDEARLHALAQIERAAGRLSLVGRQTADLSRWLAVHSGQPSHFLPVGTLVARAVSGSEAPDRISVVVNPAAATMQVRMLDRDSLQDAVGAIIQAVLREAIGEPIRIVVRRADPLVACDLLVGPSTRLADATDVGGPEAGSPFGLDRGGQGLALVLASTVLSAHQSQLWTIDGRPGLVGIRLLATEEPQS
jgi:signal transduction histidine kinase